MKKKIILAIETSCDDTSIAILNNYEVLSCVTRTNNYSFKNYGGIVPEIASRHHEANIIPVYKEALKKASIKSSEIDEIAYTSEPGLLSCLFVGQVFAKTLEFILNKKAHPINHIYSHIFSPFISEEYLINEPFLSLIVSGKTTSLFLVKENEIIEIAKTLDDALGETYDKIGKELNLEYPGGPKIDKLFDISRATIKFDINQEHKIFSYSGIKSQIINYIKNEKNKSEDIDIITIASSFQKWIIDNLIKKLIFFQKKHNINLITIGGGVSANSYLRTQLEKLFSNIRIPKKEYSCDNAAMIGYYYYIKSKQIL